MSQNNNGGSAKHTKKSDPYTLLNVSKNATEEEIQKSYKHCSRSFHPDKQPPIPEKQQVAQEVFVQFKNAYDILLDPVLRFAYDEYGHYGVLFIRQFLQNNNNQRRRQMSQIEPDEDEQSENVHPAIALMKELLQRGDRRTAYHILSDSMRYHNYKKYEEEHPLYCNMEVQCTTLHTQLFGESQSPTIYPEVEKSSLSFLLKIPPISSHQLRNTSKPTNKNNHTNKESILSELEYEIEGSCVVKEGKADISSKVGMQYEPSIGTDIRCDVSNFFTKDSKLSISSTRSMSSGTVMTVGAVSSIHKNIQKKQIDPMALSLTTKRALYQGNVYGIFSIGMGSDRNFHYTQLSLTSLYPNLPRSTCTFNLGADVFPIKFRFNHDFRFLSSSSSSPKSDKKQSNESNQSYPHEKPQKKKTLYQLLHKITNSNGMEDYDAQNGETSIGFGLNGTMKIKTSFTRPLSQLTNMTLGVQSITQKGLAFLFGLERGSFSINIPIWVTSSPIYEPMYSIKLLYTCLYTFLVNSAVTELIEMSQKAFLRRHSTSSKNRDTLEEEDQHQEMSDKEVEWILYMEEQLLNLEKAKQDAIEQTQLMIPQAKMKKDWEMNKGGLVILTAIYGLERKCLSSILNSRKYVSSIDLEMEYEKYSLDVTTQLQFWVVNSSLKLPAMSKSHMLGFYNVKNLYHSLVQDGYSSPHGGGGWMDLSLSQLWNQFTSSLGFTTSSLQKLIINGVDENEDVEVKLTVRYQFGDGIYEIKILDEEGLVLPSEKALKLGNSKYIS